METIINKTYFNIILKYVNKLCPNIRTPKYTNSYYLTNILSLLNEFVTWKSLRKSISYKNGKLANKPMCDILKDNHYKTIAAKHLLWSRSKVYEFAYKEIMKMQIPTKGDHLQLIIDATLIINKTGIDEIGYGSETRKKKFTKLTVISDNDANLIAVIAHKANDKEIKFKNNDKIYQIKTLEHEIKGIVPAISSLRTNKNITLTADAGYVMHDKDKLILKNKLKITLISPYRCNQNRENTKEEIELLKKRPKVENAIQKLKRYNRVHVRRDQLLCSYMGFVHMAYMVVHST